MANTLKLGESGYFDLPEGSQSIVHMPDGTTQAATRMWIRNNGTGIWHGYPMPEGGNYLSFYIQASNPKLQCEMEFNNDSLSDAIENIFPLNTENALLVWNYISIPLSYKYDISYMMEDVLDLLFDLQEMQSGKKIIHWLPGTFRCNWTVSWENGQLEIESYWECTVGHLEGLLNEKPVITLSIEEFISEWKEVLHTIIKGLKHCGYNEQKIGGMRKLLERYASIKEFGILYKG